MAALNPAPSASTLRAWWHKSLILALLIAGGFAMGAQAQTTVQLGSGSTTSTYFPHYYLYNYSYTQTIYTAAEMTAAGASSAGTITQIRFRPTISVATTNWRDWVIYVGNTTKAGFAGVTDYIAPDQMNLVFDGTLPNNTTADTWVELTLSTPFMWDGTSNLVVAVAENTPTWGTNPTWSGYTLAPSTGSKGIYFYHDASAINPVTPSAANQNTSNSVAQVQFAFTPMPPCTGVPVAGTLPATSEICTGNSILLSALGTTLATSLTYQWEQSADGVTGWVPAIGTPDAATYTTPPFSTATSYRLIVTCTSSGESDTTNVAAVEAMRATPAYAVFDGVAYAQGFEAWTARCLPTEVPSANWLNTPASGLNSWRRNDQGASAGWTSTAGAYTPASSSGSYSARFHTVEAAVGNTGSLDLYVDLSAATGNTLLRFGYINTSGADVLDVRISTDGGASFAPLGSSFGQTTGWQENELNISSTSSTTVIRFRATSDLGTTDIGLDNVRLLTPCTGTPVAAVASASPATVCTGNSVVLTATGADTLAGIAYQWEQSNDGATGWAPVDGGSGATTLSYTTPALEAPRYYRLVQSCSYSSELSYSNTVAVLMNNPVYAVYDNLAYAEDFEAWTSICGTSDAPNANWRVTPYSGNSSWRRNDEGSSANWTSVTLGGYTPAFSTGAHSARFHSYSAGTTVEGALDLHIDMSAATGVTRLSFDHINTNGTDILGIWTSVDGGQNFTQLGSLGISATWTSHYFDFTSNAATTVVRLLAKGGGSTDIGVDNFLLAPAPSCIMPLDPSATITSSSSAELTWGASLSNPSNGYQWEARTSGAPGSGPAGLEASGSTAAGVITALAEDLVFNSTYVFYVRADCGGGDFSDWQVSPSLTLSYCTPAPSSINSLGIINVAFGTLNNPSEAEPGNYGDYTALTGGDVQQSLDAHVAITFNTGTADYGTKIWVDWNGNLAFEDAEELMYTGLSGTTNPNTLNASFNVGMHPEGSYRMRIGATNTNTGPSTACYTGTQGAFEDYTLTITPAPSCIAPTALAVDATGTTTGTLIWTASPSAPALGYELFHNTTGTAPTEADAPTQSGIMGTSFMIEDLDPEVTVHAWVRAHCATEDQSLWTGPVSFTPSVLHIGSGAATSSNFPITSNWGYNYTQQIYLASELASLSENYITKIRFKHNATGAPLANSKDWVVYMGHTPKASFTGTTDWIPANTLAQVFNGAIAVVNGQWLELELSPGFLWDGTSNIVVAVDENTPAFDALASWAAFPAGAARGLYYRNDSNNPDPNSPPTASAAAPSTIAQIQLVYSAAPDCLPPDGLSASVLSPTSAAFSWTASISAPANYDWEVRTSGAGGDGPTGLVDAGTTATSEASTSLLAGSTTYSLYVRSNCGGDLSPWAGPFSFSTPLTTPAPWSEPFATTAAPTGWTTTGWTIGSLRGVNGNPGNNIYKNIWSTGTSGTSFSTISVGPVSSAQALLFDYKASLYGSPYNPPGVGSGNFVVAISTDFGASYTDLETVTNDSVAGWRTKSYPLAAYAGEYIKVRITGNWTIQDWDYGFDNFKIESCSPPSAPATSSLTATSAGFAWLPSSSGAGTYQWELHDGDDVLVDSGVGPDTTASSSTLSPSTGYVFRVRAICAVGDTSAWTAPLSFTTPCLPVEVPYAENFDAVSTPALPSCMGIETISGNAWRTVTAPPGMAPGIVANVSYTSSGSPDMDSWLFTQGLNLTGGVSYRLSYSYYNNSTTWTERMAVAYGSSMFGASMSSALADHSAINTTTVQHNTVDFTPSADGMYFIGFKCYSINNQNQLYLDDISVIETPACEMPTALSIDSIAADGAGFSWTASISNPGIGYQWEVRDTSTAVVANGSTVAGDTTANAGSLNAQTDYALYVRAICAEGDTSAWAGPMNFTTPCLAFDLPFQEGFNSDSPGISCWSVNNANGDGDTWALYTGYAYEGDQSAGLYTDFNAGNNDDWLISPALNLTGADRLRYFYRVRSAGEPNDFEVLLSTTGTAPADFTETLVAFAEYSNTTYEEQVVDLSAYSGTVHIAWHVPSGGLDGYYLYIDNVIVEEIPSCEAPAGLSAANFTASSAELSWTASISGPADGYEWEVRSSGAPGSGAVGLDASGTTDLGVDSAVAGSLSPFITYSAYVRANCGTAFSPWTPATTFTLGIIGSGPTVTSEYPISSCYGYSYTQEIYLASEYAFGPYIQQLRFKPTSITGGMGNSSVWTIYMGNTTDTAFASTTSWVPLASMDHVFTGTVVPVAGEWMEITLTTPFTWDGVSNIVIAVDENTPGFNCTASWAAFPTGTGNYRGMYNRSDSNNPDPASPPAGTRSTSIAQVQIVGGAFPSCLLPLNAVTTALSYTSASFAWDPNAGSTAIGYEWEVRSSGQPGTPGAVDSGTTGAGVTSASTALLTADTDYTFYVRADCGAGDFSAWGGFLSFHTGYCIPVGTSTTQGINNFSTTGGVANITNNASGVSTGGYGDFTAMAVSQQPGEAINFSLKGTGATTFHWFAWVDWNNDLDFDDADELILSSTATYNNELTGTFVLPVTVPEGNYRLRIRNASSGNAGACGQITNGEAEDYTLTVLPPPSCLRPASLSMGSVTATSAELNWDSSISSIVNGYQWEVRLSGAPGSGATGLVETGTTASGVTTATSTLLAQLTTYNAYVRTLCAPGDTSTWTGPVAFTTPCPSTGIPYAENFDDVTTPELPVCMGIETISGNAWRTVTAPPGMAPGIVANVSYTSSGSPDMDSWLFTQGLNLTGGVSYRLSYSYYNNSTFYAERMAVAYGSSRFAASMSSTLADHSAISTTTVQHNTVDFTPSADGVYYIGFKCYSINNQNQLYLDDISVIETPACEMPTALVISDITSTGAAYSWTASSSDPVGGYNWEVRTSGEAGSGTSGLADSGTTLAGITAASSASLTANTSYTLYVQSNCGGSSHSEWNESASFYTGHCIPAGTNASYYVDNFSTTGGSQNITNSGSGHSTGGYGDFSSMTVAQELGETIDFTAAFVGSTFGFRIWVDWNQDLDFDDPGEVVWSSSSYASSHSGSFAVPMNATGGPKRMRIGNSFTPNSGPANACLTNLSGEYEDYTILVVIPSCVQPLNLAAGPASPTQAELSWHASITPPALGYEWEVRTTGAGGSGATGLTDSDITAAGDTTATVNALMPGTTYSLYVRSLCAADDSSNWAGPLNFTMPQVTSSPWTEPFAATSTPAGWTTTGWLIGSIRGVTGNPGNNIYKNIFGTGSSGTSFTTINVGPLGANDQLAFDHKTSNYSSPYNAPASGSGNFVVAVSTDFGATFTDLETVTNDGVAGWRTKTYPLTAYAGQYLQVRITGNWTSGDWDMGFDNLTIASCFPPEGIVVDNITTNSGALSWVDNGSAAYDYQVRTSGTEPGDATGLVLSGSAATGTPAVTLTPLNYGTDYTVYVRSACSAADTSAWSAGVDFTPGMTQIGDGATTNTNFPISSCTAYNYTQQIYPAANYTGDPYITSIRFKYTSGGTIGNWNNWTVYMGNTAQNDFATNTSWVPLAALEQVFSGTVSPVAGEWMEITLDAPFTWDGTSNIVVAVDENTAGTYCTANWASFTSVTNSGIYHRTSTDIDPAAPGTATGRSGILAQIQMIGMPLPDCLPPTGIAVANVLPNTADLSWQASATASGYEWEVRTSGAGGSGSTGLAASGSTAGSTTATATGLTYGTDYFVYVRSACDGAHSLWAGPVSFYTGHCIPAPSSVDGQGITNVSFGGVNNTTGTEPGNYGDYSAMVGSVQQSTIATVNITYSTGYTYGTKIWVDWNNDLVFDEVDELVYTGLSTNANPTTLVATFPVGAQPLGQYRMRIGGTDTDTGPSSACYTGTYGSFEDYTLEITAPPACLTPLDLAVTNVTSTSAHLGWSDNGSGAYAYEVRTSGLPGSGNAGLELSGTVPSGNPAILLNGLVEGFTYTAYVRGVCNGGADLSAWGPGVTFSPSSEVQVGSGAGTSTAYPISSCMGYTYSQQIYLASEYTGEQTITDIRFRLVSNSSGSTGNSNNWTVYMGNTAQAAFTSGTSWIPLAQMEQVFSGIVTPITGEWMNIALTTPFQWNGTDNIVVAVDENAASWNCTLSWASFSPGGSRGIQYNSDSNNPNPASPPNGTTSTTIAQIQFGAGAPATCAAPTDLMASAALSTVQLSWTASSSAPANGYEWQVRTLGAPGSNPDGLVASGTTAAGVTSAQATGLTGNTTYGLYARALCGAGDASTWALASFTTAQPCGDSFTDTGGPTSNYGNSENWTRTYCASEAGDQVRVLFSSFNTEANWDKLFVFNGPDVNAPKFASTNAAGSGNTTYGAGGWWGNLNTNLPGPFTSSNASGCLTFAFVSDGGTNYAGWEALTQCVEPNNTCANSTPVLCGNSYAGVTSGVPNNLPASACPFNGPASTGGQNWWRFEATADQAVTFSTCGNSDFDTRISVFTGEACNDLACVAIGDDSPGCAAGSSEVTFNAISGNIYWIAVHGAGGEEGAYQLSVSCGAICTPPANDLCANAQPIASTLLDGSGVPAEFTNVCATGDGPTACSGAMPVQGVWFSFNSGAYDHAVLSLLDNGEDAQYTASALSYALYTGSCAGLGASGSAACAADGAGTHVLSVAPDTDYLLLVHNTGGSGVAGTFGLLLEHPAHDDAAITAILDPAPGLLCGSTMAPTVTLLNNGDNDLTSVQITYGLSGGSPFTYNWSGNLAYGQSVDVTLPTVPAASGTGQTLTVSASLPNGVADGLPANDAQSILVDAGGEGLMVNIMTDDSPEGLSWMIFDNATFDLVASGGGYTQANALISEQHCLSTDNSNCYIFMITDDFGDGLCCDNGQGYWELRTPQGGLLLRDLFDAEVDGQASPSYTPLNPNYGFGHNICLPAGPGNIAPTECGIFNNALGNKVYANKVAGASNYQFEFTDPDAGFIRRIARPYNYVHFWDMVSSPLVPGVKYFARVRTDRDGPMQQAHFGTGCEMGIGLPQVVTCSELIQAPAYGHSCNETRAFNTNNSFIWAKPVTGATEYQFRVFNTEEGYDQTFIRSTYILQLKWNSNVAPALINGYTYQVEVNVKVNGLYSGFCASSCTITIDNSGNLVSNPEASMALTFGDAQLWPNPVRDGQVNLHIDGLADVEQTILVDIQDIYGKQVFAKEYGNSGERFTTVLELGSEVASGVYMVGITVNGERTVQRLSVIR